MMQFNLKPNYATSRNPYLEMAEKAVKKDEVYELLMGEKGYAYRARMSVEPPPTDFLSMFDQGLCEYARLHPEIDVANKVSNCVDKLINSINGLYILSTILCVNQYNLINKYSYLNIDNHLIAIRIKQAIAKNIYDLKKEWNGQKNGLLGILISQSQSFVDSGGESFIPEGVTDELK